MYTIYWKHWNAERWLTIDYRSDNFIDAWRHVGELRASAPSVYKFHAYCIVGVPGEEPNNAALRGP